MALLISASRLDRKIGQVPVFGFIRPDVVGREGEVAVGFLEVLDAAGEEDEVGLGVGRSGPVRVRRQNFVEWWTPGNRNSSFSKLCRLTSDCELDQVLEEELGGVVGGDAGRDDAARPGPSAR